MVSTAPMSCAHQIVRASVISRPKTGSNYYQAQLDLPDKGRVIKELIVCAAD